MTAFTSGDAVHAIVGDLGQCYTKIGFAGEDYPRSYFRSNIAVSREEGASNNNKKSDSANNATNEEAKSKAKTTRSPITEAKYDFFTRPIHSTDNNVDNWNDGNWQTHNPVDNTTGLWYDNHHSDSADWIDLLDIMIRHGYKSALGTEPDRHPFLLVEKSYNPPPIRQQTLEVLFEQMNMPAVFLARDATLACYACGRTSATVVDMGYGGTTVTPVFDGYVEQKGIRRSPVGTLEMDELLLKHMDKLNPTKKPFLPLYQVRRPSKQPRSLPFHRLARLEVAQQCREEGVGASVDTTETAVAFVARNAGFTLPDGTQLQIPPPHRFAVANLLLGSDDDSQQQRDALVAKRTKELSSYIQTASQQDDDHEDDKDNNIQDTKSSPYTEATAVGIASPTTRRGRPPKATKPVPEPASQSTVPTYPNSVLRKACVPYFQTQLDQFTSAPLPQMVCDAAFRCDRDQQTTLLGNVVLAGGGACLGPTSEAMPDFLKQHMEQRIHLHTPGWRVKVLTPAPQERSIASWLGGSILGSLGTFHDMWITKAEYDDYGTAIVNRKCP